MSTSPKVLVIRLSSLGDVILATSIPAVLKRVLPGSHVSFLTKGAFLDALRHNPYIDRLIGLGSSESRGQNPTPRPTSPGNIFTIGRELRAEHFDLVVDLQMNPRSFLLSALVRPRKYTGAAKDSLRRHAAVRAKRLLSRRGRHAVQRYLFALQRLLGPVPALRPRIFITDAESESASQFLFSGEITRNRTVVAVCPGARWKTKVWGTDKMALLSKKLMETGRDILVLGGPADGSALDEMRLLLKGSEGVKFRSGSLRNIAALMAQCRCVVSNDSGLMHVSHSVGTPVVAIFGSTTPEFGFYPPDSRSTVLSKSFPCKPCDVHGKDKCKLNDLRCMGSITISEVFDAVVATLADVDKHDAAVTPDAGENRGEPAVLESPRFLLGEGEPELSENDWAVPPAGSIIVRVPNWVGDLVMALPALAAMRECAPGRKFGILAHERVAGLLERASFVDRLVILRDQRGRGFLKAALALKAERFSLGVAMPDSFSSAFLFRLAGVKKIVGFRGQMRDFLLSTRLSKQGWSHLSEQYSRLLPKSCKRSWSANGTIALARSTDGPIARVPDSQDSDRTGIRLLDLEDTDRARRLVSEAGISAPSRIALVAPGASYGETKRWPEDKFVRVIRLLTENSGFQVALVGSPAEKALCSRITAQAGPRVIDLSGRTSLRDLLALSFLASIFVGNDSGAAHVAALAGCPSIVIFGSSDPSWTAPKGRTVRTIYERVSCSPCFLAKCPYELQCLTEIDPDKVYRAAAEVSGALRIEPVIHSNV